MNDAGKLRIVHAILCVEDQRLGDRRATVPSGLEEDCACAVGACLFDNGDLFRVTIGWIIASDGNETVDSRQGFTLSDRKQPTGSVESISGSLDCHGAVTRRCAQWCTCITAITSAAAS